MSLVSGIFNSTAVETLPNGLIRGNKAVDAAFFSRIFSSFFKNGIFLDENGGGFSQTVMVDENGQTMTVRTGSGACHIRGYFAFAAAGTRYQLTPQAGARRLCHILRLDLDAGNIYDGWKECSVDSDLLISKTGELLPVRTEKQYDLITAQLDIPAGCTALDNTMLTDHRTNPELCGFVAGALTGFDTADWRRQMDTYLTELQTLVADLPKDSAAYFDLHKLNTDLSNLDENADLSGLHVLAKSHVHTADQLDAGVLKPTVLASSGSDHTAFRLRNIGFGTTLPSGDAGFTEGTILGVYV